jgi:hypothetical protein
VIVTVAVADFVVSATLVAVAVPVPAGPAVNRPACEIVPPAALHVTAVLLAFATVAVNCSVVPDCSDGAVGLIVTCTGGVIVTVAVADFVLSATLVAVTVPVPAAPAVNRPTGEIVPPVALHVTAVLLAFETVAVNCRVEPAWSDGVVGLIVTCAGGGDVVPALYPAPAPQLTTKGAEATMTAHVSALE